MSHVTRTILGNAVQTTVAGSMTNVSPGSGGTFSLTSATGWPTGTFAVIVDPGAATQETILCSGRSGTTVTVSARGYDGSTAQAHSAGATIVHAVDFVALTALLEHVNTDAGLDHSAYLQVASNGLVGDVAKIIPAGSAVAGSSGRYADAAHAHPVDAIPTFRTYRNNATGLADSTSAIAAMDVAPRDTHSGVSGLNNFAVFRYTIPSGWDGVWEFSFGVDFAFNATGYREMTVRKNGVATDLGGTRTNAVSTASQPTILVATVLLHGLVATDYVQPFIFQASGGSLSWPNNTNALFSFFAGRWVRP